MTVLNEDFKPVKVRKESSIPATAAEILAEIDNAHLYIKQDGCLIPATESMWYINLCSRYGIKINRAEGK